MKIGYARISTKTKILVTERRTFKVGCRDDFMETASGARQIESDLEKNFWGKSGRTMSWCL
jgi:hypothetical protein